jgi:hypothetical protein
LEASSTYCEERPRRRRRQGRGAPVVVSLALALLLAACGGGSDQAGTGGRQGAGTGPNTTSAVPGSPCALVSVEDVGAAVGARVRQGGSTDTAAGRGCLFNLEGAPDQTVLLVATSSPSSVSAFDSARTGGPVENLSGLGDRAYAVGGRVVVLRGTTLLVVVVALNRPPSALSQAAKAVAAKAVTRL